MSIIFGKTTKVEFDGPVLITNWNPPFKAAIYAIMIPSNKRENYYRAIYFGESENLSERGFHKSHHAFSCWLREARTESNLFIGVHSMPNSTKEQRKKIEEKLISDYNPICNG